MEKQKTFGNKWYDLYDDWMLIEASFATQYGIRLRNENDMTWGEFCTLLSGVSADTPLGNVVQIRSEEDSEKIKNFNPQQRKIRDEWLSKVLNEQHEENEMTTKEDAIKANENIMQLMAKAFGNK